MRLGRGSVERLLSNNEGFRDIQDSVSTVLDPGFHISFFMALYATDVTTKCNIYFITKCDKILLQNTLGFLLQNATVLLQNVTIIIKCDDFITKYDVYYKL